MTCQARRTPDNEWHCTPCRLRWADGDDTPPSCAERVAISETVRQMVATVDDDAQAAAAAVCAAQLWQTYCTLCDTGDPTRPWLIGIAAFCARFLQLNAHDGRLAEATEALCEGIRTAVKHTDP